jgi:disulfide bond formation protein DsbB
MKIASFFTPLLSLSLTQFQLLLVGLATLALTSALIGQYVFGLHPCELCLYQRVPFVAVILLGLIGASSRFGRTTLGMSGIAMIMNTGIAIFHSGVERKWWAGLSGCTTPDMSGSIEEVMARIATTAVTRCDEISWSFLGLSMANYNVFFCAALAVMIFIYLRQRRL